MLLLLMRCAEKYVLALKCLKAAAAIDPKSPRVKELSAKFSQTLKGAPDVPAKIEDVLTSELASLSLN